MEQQKQGEHPESLRRQIVKEVLEGKITKEQARKDYKIKGNTRIIEWIRIYEKYGVCSLTLARKLQPLMANKPQKDTPRERLELETRIKVLEQKLEDESLLREMY